MQRYVRVLLLACAVTLGCGYGEVSRTTYEYAKSLYNISNRKLVDRVAGLKQQIDASRQAGDVSDKEAKWLFAIINDAENDRWTKAMKAARNLMEDQVKR